MKLIPLPSEVVTMTGFTHKVIIGYADLTAAAGASDTTVTLNIFPSDNQNLPVGYGVLRAAHRITEAWDASDAAINSLLLEVGDDGDPNRFLGQVEIAEDGTEIDYSISAATTFPYAYTTANTIDAKFTVAGGASPLIDELNAGEVEVYLFITDLNALAKIN